MFKTKKSVPATFLFVLDFEATCWENEEKQREIIEFPIVVLNTQTLEIAGKFHEYVRPTLFPILSDFCTNLTGIKQETVDKADTLEQVFQRAKKFLSQYPLSKSVFVTVGQWDINQLFEQAERDGFDINPNFRKVLDLQAEFCKCFQEKKKRGLRRMLEYLDLEFEGRQHSGIDDCINTARICTEMIQDLHVFMTVVTKPPVKDQVEFNISKDI
ncbi:3'-5' exoribonuclease 1 [Boothiomyces sp. JEL0866]|nr:3'-5' exoribonuclease 1 [Boothiomyces sp. JEL0866]